jgi:hypothetical protein
LAVAAFRLLIFWQVSPLWVVLLAAVGGEVLGAITV